LELLFALVEGAILGVLFFIGLWWTVRKLETVKHVALLFLGSLLLRTGIVVVGFYFIMDEHWQRLVVALLGFIIARIIVTRLIRLSTQSSTQITKADHAS
jgi:F1F0 ATPase subunit 2